MKKTSEPGPAPGPEPAPTLVPTLRRRLLSAKIELRTMKLWDEFQDERAYEAFSIHKIAPGVETVLNGHSIVSDFTMTRWAKNGNMTVVEGVYVLTCVDTEVSVSVVSVGEAADDSDRGIGKALSAARKNAMNQQFNLGIGQNIEATRTKAQPEQPTMGSDSNVQPPLGAYRIDLGGMVQVIARDSVAAMVRQLFMGYRAPTQVDDFMAANAEELKRLWSDNKQIGLQISQMASSCKEALAPQAA